MTGEYLLYAISFRYAITVFITVIEMIISIKELNIINICVTKTKCQSDQ